MPKFLKIILGIVGFIVVLVVVAILLVSNQTKATEIKLDGDIIPTLYSVVGERKVTGVEASVDNGATVRTVSYDENAVTLEDLNSYIDSLMTDGYVVTSTFANNTGQLGIESKDTGKVILIDITFAEAGSTIKYSKLEGTLARY